MRVVEIDAADPTGSGRLGSPARALPGSMSMGT
jgi:hypothetical protein